MLRWQSKWNENFLFVSFLFLLLTIPRLRLTHRFFEIRSSSSIIEPSLRSNWWEIRTIIHEYQRSFRKMWKNVFHPREIIKLKLLGWRNFWKNSKCQNRNNQLSLRRRLIERPTTIELQQAIATRTRVFSRTLSVQSRVLPIAFILAPRDILHPPFLPYYYSTAFAFDANF